MKRLAIGIDDFRKIIKEDCYYVDKTKFIEAILEDASNVKLFTRPRRFGKTLNMSMLKYFFDVRESEENRELFNGLDIEKSKYIDEQGKYPTILISLKSIKYETWEESLEQLKSLVSNLYNEFEYIRKCLNESEIELFNDIWFKKENGEYANSLKNLTSFLYKYYKKEVVLLIDEYDIPLITAHKYGYYNEIINFYKIFLGEALKTNQYLKMGVLTGIIRVIKTGIFSDLNNLKVYSILEKKYSEFFGFTEEEVKKALQYFNIEEELTNVKYWYDGYKFGNSELYNPWSIINFLDGRELKNYWVGTSENFLIKNILENSTSRTNEILDKLSEYDIDTIVLAGYLRILGTTLLKEYQDRIINIHPSLLPKYGGKGMYGLNVHRAVFEHKEKESGATVHFVNETVDGGKILIQESISIEGAVSPEEIQKIVLEREWKLLPRVVKELIKKSINN